MSTIDVVNALQAAGCNPRSSGVGFSARCPAHEDSSPSLSVGDGDLGGTVVTCFAGCSLDDVLGALNLTRDVVRPPKNPAEEPLDAYRYTDEDGELLFEVVRLTGKRFRQRRPDGRGGWVWNLGDVRRPLYRLPRVIQAVAEGDTILIAEGEKDVHAIERAGYVATCNPGGAGKWRPEHTEALRGAQVIVVADNDRVGQDHARKVAQSLEGVAESVRRVEPAEGKDAFDHLAAGLSVEDFLVVSEGEREVILAPDLDAFVDADVDAYRWVVPGLLEEGDRMMITGFEGQGKALATDTPVPTPKGWTTMGSLSIGDTVFGPDGHAAAVVATSPVMLGRPCYQLRFSDGSELVADGRHEWLTENEKARAATARYERRGATKLRGTDQRAKRLHFPSVVTTEDIVRTLRARGGHTANHSIAVCEPLEYPRQELPIDPYVLGAWLGDGSSASAEVTCGDREIIEEIRQAGESVTKRRGVGWGLSDGVKSGRRPKPGCFLARLRDLGLLRNKHIPARYLQADVSQRLALLQGLMDTDGTVSGGPGVPICELTLCDWRLIDGCLELLLGLGIKATVHEGEAKLAGRVVGRRWRVGFQTDLCVFRLPRKRERLEPLRTRRAKLRYIIAAEAVKSVPVRCIQVDRSDGMFVVGDACIPTHNSHLLRQIAVCVAAGRDPLRFTEITPRRVLFIDLENSERQTRRSLRPLRDLFVAQGKRVASGMLRVIIRPNGVDLTKEADAEWLLERVRAHRPELLVIGPLYRLHAANPNDELAARLTTAALDVARNEVGCALILEAHAGHGEAGRRDSRPTGSSLWLRWPEFGYGLVPDKRRGSYPYREMWFKIWRGPRDERAWPDKLTRGLIYPWEGVWLGGLPDLEERRDDF